SPTSSIGSSAPKQALGVEARLDTVGAAHILSDYFVDVRWEVAMTTRREFLALTASAAGAALAPRLAAAGPKPLAVVRESSFIKPFDDYFAKTLAAEYEKATGVKIVYEATSVGGMLTRLTTIAETKSGPEIAMTALNWPHLFDHSLVDVS